VHNADGSTTTETVAVTIGLRDNQFTQIVSGLNEDDEVAIGRMAPVEEFNGGGPFGRRN
jgi:hypothetical protein